MSKTTRALCLLGTVVLMVVLAGTCVQRSNRQAALARYKSELRAKGEKISLADLGYPRQPDANRSFDPLITNATLLANRNVGPGTLGIFEFIGPGKARVGWRLPRPPLNSASVWSRQMQSWESLSQELEMVAGVLEAIRAATQNPPRYFYCFPNNWTNFPKAPFVEMRTAAQWLCADAMAALHSGQLDRAQADLRALTQLAQFNREDVTLVSQMIRVAIANLGLQATWEALQAPGWKDAELVALQKAWEELDLTGAMEQGILGERAIGEAAFAQMRSARADQLTAFGQFSSAGSSRPWRFYFDSWVVMPLWRANSEADERLFLEYHQRSLESFRKLKTGTAWFEVDRELQAHINERNKAFGSFLSSIRYRFTMVSIPNTWVASRTAVRAETFRRLTVTAIALERFKLRQGRPPPDLEALVPEFLSAVPVDPMSGKALCYQPQPEQNFLLYSAGENGRDDHGDPTSLAATNTPGLWYGNDAVWPVGEP